MTNKAVFIVGAGKAGVGLALALTDVPATLITLSTNKSKIGPLVCHPLERLKDRTSVARVVILAVPDKALVETLTRLINEGYISSSDVVGHLSGAMPSSIFATQDLAGYFSAHPLHAFAPVSQALPMPAGTAVMIEGTASKDAVAIFLAAKAKTAIIDPANKPLCHAAAVAASNLPAALLLTSAKALSDAGVPQAELVAVKLANSLLANWERSPNINSLTGPMARGDLATIKSNLAALEGNPSLQTAYKVLTKLLAAELEQEGMLDAKTAGLLEDILS